MRGLRFVHQIRAFQSRTDAARDTAFDHIPTSGKVRVPLRQSPNAMHVIGKQHPGVDVERMRLATATNRIAQRGAHVFVAEETLPTVGDDREKVGAARSVRASEMGHFFCGRVWCDAWATSCPPYLWLRCWKRPRQKNPLIHAVDVRVPTKRHRDVEFFVDDL